MTAFFCPALTIAAVLGSVALSVSQANAMTLAKPAGEASTSLVHVDYRGDDRRYRHQHRHYRNRGRHVVHAPFTRVESGRRTVVDAPFVHVYKDRHGKHIVAPFVDLYR
ncbi:hypothetical protein [Hyphomicrobium facile]|uniref:Uncharacterized protein n=1 Tax=Hyphomicrobium facile TaxID=51670 RepID=A0A1I7N018_9HYPH|nr:hypothetical protein [Hyphomicrobium facile]SFV28001.1 hypothetical protein SAMN04488557_0901 [Hyphomicrobium facile]